MFWGSGNKQDNIYVGKVSKRLRLKYTGKAPARYSTGVSARRGGGIPDRDPPWTETLLDRDPPRRTETLLDRDPPGQRPLVM